MKYAYTTKIDRVWKGGLWFGGDKKLLTEQEVAGQKYVVPWWPTRIILGNDQTLEQYLEGHSIHPSVWESIAEAVSK